MEVEDVDGPTDAIAFISDQAEDLCHIHDHPTRVIANLDIPTEVFSDYDNPGDADFPIEGIVKLFLYKGVRGFDQSETARRLRGAAYVYVRFGLSRPPTQAGISYSWRRRLKRKDRQIIKEAAERISDICQKEGVLDRGEPALRPEDVRETGIEEKQIMNAVELATELGFDEFRDPRADNCKYDLQAYLERQGYLNMVEAGTTTKRRRFARLSDRSEVPHGSSHNRTMKKVAEPDPQTALWEFQGGRRQEWKHIRDTVLPAFHAGVGNILDEIAARDRSGIREPVNAAIDITTWNYWSSPFRDEEDVDWSEDPVELRRRDGTTREVYPRDDYPEMVSGFKDGTMKTAKRGYKFATLTIVAQDTPIVLAIEPVRDKRQWEPEDVETRTRGELVDRLLEQAKQHVDINKVFADREFDSYEVRHAIDRHDMFYVIGKRQQAEADRVAIEKTVEHETADVSVEHGTLTYDGETHDMSFLYVPKDTSTDDPEFIEGDYAIFTLNAHVSPDRAIGLTQQYRDRWMIENEYKTIKNHFLPTSASADYRNRFLYFVIGVTLYNVWRLTNFLLRDEVEVNLGEDPPILAGEIVELVGFCLFDPGG
ncbi:transposase [Halorientalis salina]|uniref:transposase n=1 Tax=Halorientalis salina TaxID=2932266 RepID=UPI0010AB5B8D|nr:transposase [Halorientalis salina]